MTAGQILTDPSCHQRGRLMTANTTYTFKKYGRSYVPQEAGRHDGLND